MQEERLVIVLKLSIPSLLRE